MIAAHADVGEVQRDADGQQRATGALGTAPQAHDMRHVKDGGYRVGPGLGYYGGGGISLILVIVLILLLLKII